MITEEDKKIIRNLVDAKNHSRRVSASQVTELYNRILNKNARITGCAGCLRQRICDLERWLNQYEIDEAKAAEETTEITENQEDKPKKRGRKKKEE